ncbi:TIGR02281 family clan AA aspartic protease, partial [Rhizobium ruizarguesonis]
MKLLGAVHAIASIAAVLATQVPSFFGSTSQQP